MPVPQSEKNSGEDKNTEIETLLENNSGNSNQPEEYNYTGLEELILDKIKNN